MLPIFTLLMLPAHSAIITEHERSEIGLSAKNGSLIVATGLKQSENEDLKLKIAFCNVDLACDDNHIPKPRSEKGACAERASGATLFPDLPHYAPRPVGDGMLYYLMTDQSGAAELTRPIISGGTFIAAVERIYLSSGDNDDPAILAEDDRGPADNFDPQVVRK
jgi:hypothetical protein